MVQPGSEHIVKITPEVVFQDDGTTAYRTKVMGELVRCGECKHRDKVTGWCEDVQDYISNINWFCAGGERKDGADE